MRNSLFGSRTNVGACFLLTVSLGLAAALPPFAKAGQAVNDVLNFGITGTVRPSTPPHRNPLHILGRRSVQAMLLELAKMPRKRDFVEKALIGLKVSVADQAFWLEKHLRLHSVLPLLKAKLERR